MRRLRDFSIRGKLVALTLLNSGIGLLVFGTALLAYDLVAMGRTIREHTITLADVVANNSTAALTFGDEKTADEVLRGLSAHPQVIDAALYTSDGRLFASYTPSGQPARAPARAGPDGWQFTAGHFFVFRPVFLDGKRLGTLYIDRSLRERTAQIRVYLTMMGILLGATLLVVFFLSTTLQRIVSALGTVSSPGAHQPHPRYCSRK